ncbi:MAG: hypothetical protein K8953_09245, partial [Proteobacteria bacterium]|nr:hypothetical protein [Pseudomonadota bacterium]
MSFYNKLNQPTLIHQDFETFSEVDISRVGGVAYSCHPSTQVLICGYAFDNGEVRQWIPAQGEPLPAELEDAVLDPRILKYGWHASFEQAIWTNTLRTPTPAPSWRDTMVMAKVCSFPGKLSSVCDILALLPSHKKKDGTEVIKYFCTPHGGEQRTRHDNPDLWLDALEYNKFDVLAMQRIYAILKNFAPSDSEWDLWQIDQKINQFGLPVNLDMVRNACAIADDLMPRLASRITAITGIDRPKNRDKILYWLKAHGYKFDDLKAENVARALDKTPKHTELYEVLHLRQQISKKSASHFPAFLDATDSDGRARHLFNFNNTRQGRWTAHGPRPHGLSGHAKGFEDIKWVRTAGGHKKAVDGRQLRISRAIPKMKPSDFRMFFENPIEVLGGCVRHAIEAPKGRVIISADLKFIEHLVLGWIAEDKEILSVIRSGKDPYLFFATRIYDLPYEELFEQYKGGDDTKRKLAKPGLLGCGLMMGWQALLEHASKNGVELP